MAEKDKLKANFPADYMTASNESPVYMIEYKQRKLLQVHAREKSAESHTVSQNDEGYLAHQLPPL